MTSTAIGYSHYETIIQVSNIGTGLSLVGELVMICLFLKSWKHWISSGIMIACMTLSYLLYTIANILMNFQEYDDNLEPNFTCKADGFLRTIGYLSCMFWAHKISQNAYYTFTDPDFRVDGRSKAINLLKGFLIPTLIALL